MAAYNTLLVRIQLLVAIFPGVLSQSTSVAQNSYDSLTKLNCSQFKAIIEAANLQQRYKSPSPLTLFVFVDAAYNRLPPYMVTNLYDRSSANNGGANEYVSSFTVDGVIETSSFSKATPYPTWSVKSRKLFLNMRNLRVGNTASGQAGPTKYFANGAMIVQPNIQAGQHVIHILDRVLPLPLFETVLAYVSGYNPDKKIYKFFELFMSKLSVAPQEDSINNYQRQVRSVLVNLAQPVTFFLPSDRAVERIPEGKKGELLGNPKKLLRIITLHIVPKQALYTSLVNHNEQFNTQYNSGRVVFRKNFDREAVYVSGALRQGSTVTARVSSPNITVLNGVVHHIDEVLGFVYKTVMQEISLDPVTTNFEQLIKRARIDLQQTLGASNGVYVFAPTTEAMQAILNIDDNYINDQALINMVLERSILQPDQFISLTDHSGGYESFNIAKSRYNSEIIKIYSAGNDTWVEGGYVKARVVKPDIGCINGVVHQIDAVFGIPTRDLPHTIFCEDWLQSTYIQLKFVGLDNYMRDTQLMRNQACKFSANTPAGNAVPNTGNRIRDTDLSSSSTSTIYQDLCGYTVHRCEFTFFVPNGTAIDNFQRTTYGKTIMQNRKRWRWILRRLLTFREVIYLDRMAPGSQRVMYSDNGDEVVLRTDSRSNIPSAQRTAYIKFESVEAKVIHSDIGATNGVMHIIDSVLFVLDDLTRDVSSAPIAAHGSIFLLTMQFVLAFWMTTDR
ncbi:hypothetical protein RRG08_036271 [Elysia crispata]|uniref:FAS1 domain-containing protein n=1 Tax=Elysia crispata TaxID=231223 RepID=A0AAE0YYG6_9GAST|nr:hypothetical protein RRG08_036271 [Elysia crispata]